MISRSLLGAAFAVVLMSATSSACGVSAGGVTSPESSTLDRDPTRITTSTAAQQTTVPAGPLPAEELARAEHAVVSFVDSLGVGDLDAAAAVVGPISQQQAHAAGGFHSLLQQSTEGHGAWIGSHDRVVTPVGIATGLVVVVLEGTLQVEGATEHRVASFPVRKVEPAGTWLVEPWAHEIGKAAPLFVRTPEIDAEDRVRIDFGEPVTVRVETALEGTVWAVFGDGMPTRIDVASGERATELASDNSGLVVVVFDAGPTLYATAFRVVSSGAPVPTTPSTTIRASPIISVPFLSGETNQLLRSCAAGNDASCEAALTPGVLDARAFPFFRERCAGGDQIYCRLFEHLVDAEQRVRAPVPRA